jgi:hypothetical protein
VKLTVHLHLMPELVSKDIVAYSLKARILESKQSAVTRQRPINNNKGMVLSAQPMPMAAHATMEYVMLSLSKNCTAIEERCFPSGPCRDIMSRISLQFYLDNRWSSVL